MAIRNILLEGEPTLSKKSRVVEKFDERLAILIDDMKEILLKENGVGLAAPQVGVLKRVIIVDIGEEMVELVNPEITKRLGKQEDVEGCLSCPGEYGITARPMKVTIKGKNRFGKDVMYEGEALTARAFCHEVDHLDGVLFKRHVIRMLTKEELE
ncbi:MAG: Peptide deformylase 1 [Eubacteriales bacterium SKADARSKE-1]|nr:Peptide deformylase 1 [Eubacteriales bacterium SKADARSKE-1]